LAINCFHFTIKTANSWNLLPISATLGRNKRSNAQLSILEDDCVTIKPMWMALMLTFAVAGCGALKSESPDGLSTSVVKVDGREPIVQSSVEAALYNITEVNVTVPSTLRVSEENLFYPDADVVWRGEPQGDRLEQVKAIVEDGFAAGIVGMKTGPKAVMGVQLERFHALTEKARFSVGGVHDVVFVMVVREVGTNAILEEPRRIEVPIRASGGDSAIAEDAAGRTQRVVIVEGLAEAIRRELSAKLADDEPQRRGLFAGLSLGRGTQ
jgi:hypothetical protein